MVNLSLTSKRKRTRTRTSKKRYIKKYRKRNTNGYVKDSFVKLRTTRLSTLPKRAFIRQDITVRVYIPAASQQYNWTLISANSVNDMFAPLLTLLWSPSQTVSPASISNVKGYSTLLNAQAYQKYQVHAAKLTVTVRPQSLLDNGRAFIMPVASNQYTTYNTSPSAASVRNAFNQTGCMSWDYCSNYTERNNTRTMYIKTNNLEGKSPAEYNADVNYIGVGGSPPAKNAFLVGYQKDSDSTMNGGFAMTFDLSYWVEYFDLITSSVDV